METRTIFVTIRVDLASDREITDEMVEDFVADCNYSFSDTDEVKVTDTWWNKTDY